MNSCVVASHAHTLVAETEPCAKRFRLQVSEAQVPSQQFLSLAEELAKEVDHAPCLKAAIEDACSQAKFEDFQKRVPIVNANCGYFSAFPDELVTCIAEHCSDLRALSCTSKRINRCCKEAKPKHIVRWIATGLRLIYDKDAGVYSIDLQLGDDFW